MQKILEELINCDVAQDIAISVNYKGQNYFAGSEKLFDLASLTKICTTFVILKLEKEGKINLSDDISMYLPELEKSITIIDLLSHNSGIDDPQIGVDDEILTDTSNIIKNINAHQLVSGINYSDVNFILLYYLIEKLSDIKDEFRQLYGEKVMFNPPLSLSIAPTEILTDRHRAPGIVHDNKCFKQGGVSGHAGAFAKCSDFHHAIISQVDNLDFFYKHIVGDELKRTIGFLLTDKQTSKFEEPLFHTGFTGTSILIAEDVSICIFTNRVYPTRDNTKIFAFRELVHQRIYEAIYA